eukprot:Awhi_evm1s14195
MAIDKLDIPTLLKDANALATFYTFATTIFSEENIAFIRDFAKIKAKLMECMFNPPTDYSAINSELNLFFNLYFSLEPVYELNCPNFLKKEVVGFQSMLSSGNEIPYVDLLSALEPINTHIGELINDSCLP